MSAELLSGINESLVRISERMNDFNRELGELTVSIKQIVRAGDGLEARVRALENAQVEIGTKQKLVYAVVGAALLVVLTALVDWVKTNANTPAATTKPAASSTVPKRASFGGAGPRTITANP